MQKQKKNIRTGREDPQAGLLRCYESFVTFKHMNIFCLFGFALNGTSGRSPRASIQQLKSKRKKNPISGAVVVHQQQNNELAQPSVELVHIILGRVGDQLTRPLYTGCLNTEHLSRRDDMRA